MVKESRVAAPKGEAHAPREAKSERAPREKATGKKRGAATVTSSSSSAVAASKGAPRPPMKPIASFIVGDLQSDMRPIYSRTVQSLLSNIPARNIGEPEMISEVDGATLIYEVASKDVAEKMYRRLQNANVYGKRWKVEYMPLSAVTLNTDTAAIVDIRLNPAGLKTDVVRSLSGVQGFLAVDDAPLARGGSNVDGDDSVNSGPAPGVEGADDEGEEARQVGGESLVRRLVATFAEEGAAIHARAIFSGRLVGTNGARMFLSLRSKQQKPPKAQ